VTAFFVLYINPYQIRRLSEENGGLKLAQEKQGIMLRLYLLYITSRAKQKAGRNPLLADR